MDALQRDGANAQILDIRLFGRFEVFRNGKPIPDEAWGRRKTKTLLKVLLTQPGRVFTQDQLIDALFDGEGIDKATKNLYGRISELRRALEPGLSRGGSSSFIVRNDQGYAFEVSDHCRVDVLDFAAGVQAAVSLADQGKWIEAIEAFEAALPIRRDTLLAEDRYEDWAEPRRKELGTLYLDGLSQLSECYARVGRLRQAIVCCQKILSEEPYRESVIRQLMKHQHAAGLRSRALETYRTGEEALREHLDVDPEPATLALFESLSRSPKEESVLNPHRVAVIPFVSIGSDPATDDLAAGMTEELIYTLSKVKGLEVIAQTTVLKYKGALKSVEEIGQELRVGSLLEGSVQVVQDKARILVQLIHVENEAHLWAEQYNREIDDLLGVQGAVARSVASALRLQLLSTEETALRKVETADSEAHACYMKGRLFLAKYDRDAAYKAIKCFEEALRIRPDHARAYTGLADAHFMLIGYIPAEEGYEKVRFYTEQALALDPECAEAHATLGGIAWRKDGDIQKAESELLRSIDLNPNYTNAHEEYAMLLARLGRHKEACRQSEISMSLDPLSAPRVIAHAECLHEAGRLVEAIAHYEQGLELDPLLKPGWWGLWFCLAAQWDWDQALAVTRRLVEHHPDNPFAHVNRAQCFTCLGRIEEGLDEIRMALDLATDPKPVFVLVHAAYAHYFARQYDKAIEYVHQVLEVNPSLNMLHNGLAKCYIQQGKYDKALEELDAAEQKFEGADVSWNAHVHMDRGIVYARIGETAKAERELEILTQRTEKDCKHFGRAGILLALGRPDDAMDALETAATARESHVVTIRKVGTFDDLRSHPRFQALLRRIGLAD